MVARTWLAVVATAALATLVRIDAADPGLCITTLCLANGTTECDRARTKCPSCMYMISGGFSCYDKINGECPYPDVLTTCSTNQSPPLMRTPSPSPSIATAASASASIDRPATVMPPRIDTPPALAPAPTTVVSSATAPPTMTTAPPRTSPPSSTANTTVPETQSSNPNSMQSNPTSTSSESAGMRTGATDGRSTVSSSAPSSLTPSPSPSTEKTSILDASSGVSANSKSLSSMYVNIGVIVAAVGGIALVALFITRRMRERRDRAFLSTPEEDKDFSLQVDPRSGPSGRVFGTLGRSVSAGTALENQRTNAAAAALRSARTRSTSDIPSLLSMDSLTSSAVEFVDQHHPYGLPSQFGVPSDATFANSSSSHSSSFSASNVSVSSAALGFSQVPGSAGGRRPQQIDEDSDFAFYNKRKQSVGAPVTVVQTPLHLNASARPVHQPVYHERIRRTSSATGNIYEDEYDIVHPHALRDGDRRNTETLVQDGRFQSNFSEHDVQAMKATRNNNNNNSDDDDDDRFFASKEHEI